MKTRKQVEEESATANISPVYHLLLETLLDIRDQNAAILDFFRRQDEAISELASAYDFINAEKPVEDLPDEDKGAS